MCIFACICKNTHFWPNRTRTFGPESDAHLTRSVCVFLCVWVQPNRMRRMRMRIRMRSAQCIACGAALIRALTAGAELRRECCSAPHKSLSVQSPGTCAAAVGSGSATSPALDTVSAVLLSSLGGPWFGGGTAGCGIVVRPAGGSGLAPFRISGSMKVSSMIDR